MKWVCVAASILALTAPVAGCGIGDTMRQLARETSTPADAPSLAVSSDEVVAKARPSVVKVHGEAESCQKITDGSGFVVAPTKVMTNAHVVAGAETFSVDAEGEAYGADIYRATSVTRQVYILIGSFPQAGASGSAVVDLYGQVIGVYFDAETHDSTTGFAITAAQVAPPMARAGGTRAADTGDCVY
jgi:S1-C subfamily serine protease